jgi:hypothetical protein
MSRLPEGSGEPMRDGFMRDNCKIEMCDSFIGTTSTPLTGHPCPVSKRVDKFLCPARLMAGWSPGRDHLHVAIYWMCLMG